MSYDMRNLANALMEVIEATKEKENLTPEQQELRGRKAAYALNLCTVSVSQIIDYDDIAVMEHEYEAILNNLNLQNMPKDQELLNILNHLLDTITFFRIQEKEKVLVEKRYQSQVKNAIWEAVPSLSILTNWRDPLNVVATVGLSYMNYRRKKATYALEKEFEDFQLERAAMEQFNNLQRELFDTSWRLADVYNFNDKYRLTERQIRQYNEILMDSDPIRRFERLDSIQENFVAYPPYWYYLGHAALEIVNKDKRTQTTLSEAKKQSYINIAQKAFDKLLNDKLYDILREDAIVSACALEYIDTLDAQKDKNKIEQLIKRAYEMSGNAYDIWQFCALAYLRIDKMGEACTLLRRLVNEGYNEEMNAQLLSSIYMKIYVYSGSKDAIEDYKVLSLRTRSYDLFSIPEARTVEAYDECQREFVEAKKRRLKERYGTVLLNYMHSCNLEFSKLYNAYVNRAVTDREEIISFFNRKVLPAVYELPGMSRPAQHEVLNLVALKLEKYKNKFLFENDEKKDKKQDNNLFVEIMYPAFSNIGERIKVHIDTAENLADVSEAENKLTKFCESVGIDVSCRLGMFEEGLDDNLLNVEVFGKLSENAKKRAEQDKKAKDILTRHTSKVLKNNSKNTEIYVNSEKNKAFYDKYFSDEIFYHGDYRFMMQTTVAILTDTKKHDDIIITLDGIRRRYHSIGLFSEQVRFDEIGWGKKGKEEILLGDIIWKKYSNADVNLGALLDLFRELKNNARENYAASDEMNPFNMLVKI